MAVDKKSQHVGNHGGRYTDLDGLSRQFTYIDHDKKSKMSKSSTTEEEIVSIKEQQKTYRKELQERILAIPASLCPDWYHSFTIRGANTTQVKWNEEMIRDEGVDTERLRTLTIMLENRVELHRLTI